MTDNYDDHRAALADVLARMASVSHNSEPCIVTRWVLTFESMDAEGEPWISTLTSDGLPRWDRIGLLHFALDDIQSAMVVRDLQDDE